MTGIDDCLIGKFKHLTLQRTDDRFERSAPQVRAANASRKERVSGKKPARLVFGRFCRDDVGSLTQRLGGHIKTHAALRMTWRVHHLRFEASPAHGIALAQQLADFNLFRRLPANPRSLDVQHAIKLQIVGVHSNGRASRFLDAPQSPNVIDMCVSDDDRRDMQFVTMDHIEDSLGVFTRINHQGVARFWIPDNMAIALQHSYRKDFMNEIGCF